MDKIRSAKDLIYPYLLNIIELHLANKDIKEEDRMSRDYMMKEIERFKPEGA